MFANENNDTNYYYTNCPAGKAEAFIDDLTERTENGTVWDIVLKSEKTDTPQYYWELNVPPYGMVSFMVEKLDSGPLTDDYALHAIHETSVLIARNKTLHDSESKNKLKELYEAAARNASPAPEGIENDDSVSETAKFGLRFYYAVNAEKARRTEQSPILRNWLDRYMQEVAEEYMNIWEKDRPIPPEGGEYNDRQRLIYCTVNNIIYVPENPNGIVINIDGKSGGEPKFCIGATPGDISRYGKITFRLEEETLEALANASVAFPADAENAPDKQIRMLAFIMKNILKRFD